MINKIKGLEKIIGILLFIISMTSIFYCSFFLFEGYYEEGAVFEKSIEINPDEWNPYGYYG